MDGFKVHARFAAKLSRDMIDFLVDGMRVRDAETVEKCGKEKATYIAGIRASIFENLTFLRMKIVVELAFAEWCQFVTRRCTMRIQMYLSDPKALNRAKGAFYCFFNKFTNGTNGKKVGKLTKCVLEGHVAFSRYMTLLPQSIKIHLRKVRDSEGALKKTMDEYVLKLEACHKEMCKYMEDYEELEGSVSVTYPPSWTNGPQLSFVRPDVEIDPKALPYPIGKHDPTLSLGMMGDEFNGFDDPDIDGQTSELVELARRMETHPGDDWKVWENMGGMGNSEMINIPQL